MDKDPERPPMYVSRKRLAHELDAAESTVDELVRRGVLPKPLHLSPGCVRWPWDDVTRALASLRVGASVTEIDPYLQGLEMRGTPVSPVSGAVTAMPAPSRPQLHARNSARAPGGWAAVEDESKGEEFYCLASLRDDLRRLQAEAGAEI